MIKSIRALCTFCACCAVALCCLAPATTATTTATATPTTTTEDLGHVDFPTSGPEEAQLHFVRGVLWLHSFEYADAREEFRQALELDPSFAMAVWGEAMTHNYPVWNRVELDSGRQALEQLGKTREERLAKAPTERERGYLGAVDTLFFTDGDKAARDRAYLRAMESLAQRFPQDLEAASFHALALLGSCEGERDVPTYMRAAAVAEEVFAKNPRHPGAAHYLIHSYDDPVHGPLGLRAARAYAQIAPSAPHALHMPSHIFLALGMWDASVASNEDSWEAALARGHHNYHALWWLLYSQLQQKRFEAARGQLETLVQDIREDPSEHARIHLAYMRAAYLVDSGDREAAKIEVDLEGLDPAPVAAHHFAEGYLALHDGEIEPARQALEAIRERRAAALEGTGEGKDLRTTDIMAKQLEALLALAEGHGDEALAKLDQALAIESAMSFDFGPPVPIKPTEELYGEVLLQLGRPEDALPHLERALELHPGRAVATQARDQAANAVLAMQSAGKGGDPA